MQKQDLKIVFLGNPEFARYHLEQLIEHGFNVVGVVSAADKPAGRGLKMHSTPVAQFAKDKGIPLLQPLNLKDPGFLKDLANLKADLQVVIAFRMLPEVVWNMPPLGTYNIHASLLPQYRGAAPINWAIINGETESGVSSFKLQHEIDTGNILLQQKCEINSKDDAGSLHDKLMVLGAATMIATLNALLDGSLKEQAQSTVLQGSLKKAPKIFSKDCEINWNSNVEQVYNHIRGLSPYPVAYTFLDGKRLKIYNCTIEYASPNVSPGSFIQEGDVLRIAAKNGYIKPGSVQLEGKRRMEIDEFLRGYSHPTKN